MKVRSGHHPGLPGAGGHFEVLPRGNMLNRQ
jgi:hypothetical protein